MQLYLTSNGTLLYYHREYYIIYDGWDWLINRDHLYQFLLDLTRISGRISTETAENLIAQNILPPVGSQEVWAAGVTYLRSRDARMEESKQSGGADFYQKVYEAQRPELFFKALPQRVSGHGGKLYIRKDSPWNVPEPELTLFINSHGNIQAYTIGNDMSSRSIEGENPLYLPQAKVYEKSAGLGPCLFIPEQPIAPETLIHLSIIREGLKVFEGQIGINRMKRKLEELAAYLFLECEFPQGCFLMTGTGVVPPDDFTLRIGDIVDIHIDRIGTLTNIIAQRP